MSKKLYCRNCNNEYDVRAGINAYKIYRELYTCFCKIEAINRYFKKAYLVHVNVGDYVYRGSRYQYYYDKFYPRNMTFKIDYTNDPMFLNAELI